MKHKTKMMKVEEFHKAFGLAIDEPVTEDLMSLRDSLIKEEGKELSDEMVDTFLSVPRYSTEITPNMIKEMTDLLYVVYGMAVSFGIDLDTAFNRTHISNMSKLGEDGKPIYREDGKVIKGPNYAPPDMSDLVPNIQGELFDG